MGQRSRALSRDRSRIPRGVVAHAANDAQLADRGRCELALDCPRFCRRPPLRNVCDERTANFGYHRASTTTGGHCLGEGRWHRPSRSPCGMAPSPGEIPQVRSGPGLRCRLRSGCDGMQAPAGCPAAVSQSLAGKAWLVTIRHQPSLIVGPTRPIVLTCTPGPVSVWVYFHAAYACHPLGGLRGDAVMGANGGSRGPRLQASRFWRTKSRGHDRGSPEGRTGVMGEKYDRVARGALHCVAHCLRQGLELSARPGGRSGLRSLWTALRRRTGLATGHQAAASHLSHQAAISPPGRLPATNWDRDLALLSRCWNPSFPRDSGL